MSSKIHPQEMFLTKLSTEQLKLLKLEVEIFDKPKAYLEALKDQFNRLEIKL